MQDGIEQFIVGQGLAGACVGWEFLRRGAAFRIADRGDGGSSWVAAGIVNPITGKNFEPSWRIAEFHPKAIAFYESLETEFGVRLWHPMPVLRVASTEKEWAKIFSKLGLPQTMPWLGSPYTPTPEGFTGSVELFGGGWLDTRAFLRLTREHFTRLGLFVMMDAEKQPCRIRCEGAAGLMTGDLGAHRCAKGEILTVRALWPETHICIGAGGWLVPIGDGLFRVGSTYEWDDLDEQPTAAGLNRITEIAIKLGGEDFELVDHVAGIRPILRRSQPLIGKDRDGNWIFNGLGSKGTLYAPGMAIMLADWILEGKTPHTDFIHPQVL